MILKIGNIFTDIEGDVPSNIKDGLKKELSFRPLGYQFNPKFAAYLRDKDGKPIRRMWDGYKYQFWSGKKRTYFPTGLYSIVSNFLDNNNAPYHVIDCRIKPQQSLFLDYADDMIIRDYQSPIINIACEKTRGIIQAATGAGKTAIAAGIIKELKVSPFIFFVTSIDLLTQAKESFEKFLRFHGSNLKVGQVGGGVIDIADVNVMTIQTAVRALGSAWNKDTKFDTDDTDDDTSIDSRKEEIKELINSAAGAIGDEIQHWRANTCQLVARELKNAYYTYGLSATPYRDEGDDLMIQACFGKKIATISASQLIRDGWLIKPQIKFVNFRNMHSKYKTWQPIYKEMITENDYYNKSCASIANKYIENDRIVLVLVQHVKHGKDLADMIDGAKFLSGSSPKKQRQEGIEQLRSKKIKCIVSTQIFDEGIDVRSLDTLLLCGQGKSKVRAMQRIGRILRPYTDPVTGKVKTTATAIDFKLHCKYLKQHANEREAMYRTEEEFAIEHIG